MKNAFYSSVGGIFAEGTRFVNETQIPPETIVLMISIAYFCG